MSLFQVSPPKGQGRTRRGRGRAREGEGKRAEHLGVCSWLNRLGFAWQGPFGCDQARSGFGMGKYHPRKSRELTKNNLYVLLGAYWGTRRKEAVDGRRTTKKQMRATRCLLGSGTRRKEAGAVHQDTHTHTHAQCGRCAGLRRALPPCPTARSEGEAQREKLDLQRLRFSSLYIALCAAVWICSACALAIFYSIAPRIPPGRDVSTSGSDARL